MTDDKNLHCGIEIIILGAYNCRKFYFIKQIRNYRLKIYSECLRLEKKCREDMEKKI